MDDSHLARARGGDGAAFQSLVSPLRRGLRAHCYRMLGSLADAEDAVQDTLVRAWKALAAFEGRSSVRTWLTTIATRVCLDRLAARPPRRLPDTEARPSDPRLPPSGPVLDPVWLEPLPDAAWADGPLDLAESPEAACTRRQGVALAFLASIQLLPATQRAALLLHDVAGWSAEEIAGALDSSTAAVNSSLQRARASLDQRLPGWNGPPVPRSPREADTLQRYVAAWELADPDRLAQVLREDAVMVMPPVPQWFRGRADVVDFYRAYVLALGLRLQFEPAGSVNGAPALRSRVETGDGWVVNGLHLLELDAEGRVTRVVVFMGPE